MSSQEQWMMQLWSGLFGSALSAVLAALVAILVVKLTADRARSEESRKRELAAISDLFALTTVGRNVGRGEEYFIEYQKNVISAASRWCLELDPAEPMRSEVMHWAHVLPNLARQSHEAALNGDPEADLLRRQGLIESFAEKLLDWPQAASNEARRELVATLARVRQAASGPLENDPLFVGWL